MNAHTLAPAGALGFVPAGSGGAPEGVREEWSGLLKRWKESGSWLRKQYEGISDLGKGVILAVGIILGYSGGAAESLVRDGKMLLIDAVGAAWLAEVRPNPKLERMQGQLLVLQEENRGLVARLSARDGDDWKHVGAAAAPAKTATKQRMIEDKTANAAAVSVRPAQESASIRPALRKVVDSVYALDLPIRGADEDRARIPDPALTNVAVPSERKISGMKKAETVPYDAIKGLIGKIQSEASIDGASLRVQEQHGGKCKIWVEYAGRKSKSFFSDTPKHQWRLTEEGMAEWYRSEVRYLASLDDVERIGRMYGIGLKNARSSASETGLLIKTGHVEGKSKIRFQLFDVADPNAVVDFTMDISEIPEMLPRDFTIAKKRLYAMAW